jgi:hypothetical protein
MVASLRLIQKSPRADYFANIILTAAAVAREQRRDGIVEGLEATLQTLAEIKAQAASDWRMTQRDVDVIEELVDSYVRLIQENGVKA